MCSAKCCDNLLVEADISIILGVSVCVTRKAFSFVRGQERLITWGHSSESLLFPYVVIFLIDGVVGSILVAQKISLRRLHCHC